MDPDKPPANTKAYLHVRIAMIAVAHWHSLKPLLAAIVVSPSMLSTAVDRLATSWPSSYRVVFGAERIKAMILLGTYTVFDHIADQALEGMILHTFFAEKRSSQNWSVKSSCMKPIRTRSTGGSVPALWSSDVFNSYHQRSPENFFLSKRQSPNNRAVNSNPASGGPYDPKIGSVLISVRIHMVACASSCNITTARKNWRPSFFSPPLV